MGLLDYLSPALTVGTQAAGAYQGAQAHAQQGQQEAIIRAVQMKRQQEQDALQRLAQQQKAQHDAALLRLQSVKPGPGGQLVDFKDPDHPASVGPAPRIPKVKVTGAGGDVQFVDPDHPPTGLRERDPVAQATTIHKQNRAFDVAHPLPSTARPRQPSMQERQASLLVPEMEDAAARIDGMQPDKLQELWGRIPIAGNYLRTDAGRQFEQTAVQFLQNAIYLKSGKAITAQEAKALFGTYIQQAGDDTQTLTQKGAARRRLVAAAKSVAAGTPSATPTPQAAPKATDAILNKYGLEPGYGLDDDEAQDPAVNDEGDATP